MQLCVLGHRRLSALTAQVRAQLLCAPGTTTHAPLNHYLLWGAGLEPTGGWEGGQ